MPGILPMKVIKIGSSTQSRVAQACDRCRSKKIRCDGVTPSCSQCANVGFECKTSDKLSRRAFPRGYTESLEERVRSLESEVRELKDLLDTKDEKIDILSRIQSSSPLPKRASSKSSNSDSNTSQAQDHEHRSQNDNASMQDVAHTENPEFSISCSASASSGKSFVDAFRNELRANVPQAPNFKTQVFFNSWESRADNDQASEFSAAVPSRMASDQMMNIFLQEWLPLFPMMHRSNVLQLYSSYVTEPESIQSRHEAAQLYLIFGISTLSAQWNNHGNRLFEQRWQSALDLAVKQVSVASLQGVLLAMLYCIAKQDHEKLRRYKNMSAKLTRRLGLHQSQKRSSLGPLATEMRKRLFWTSFTLDCFSSAILGQSRAFCDIDVACEFPLDVDDENVTEESFLTGTPGECTRISSALALFRGARIMADVLDTVYSSTPPHEVSSLAIASLRDQLDSWYGDLAPHLCLKFLQEKPSSAVVGNRAPFLALMHDYTKTLLYRPLVLADNQSRPPAALISLAQSSKHIIQIIQLLEERRLSFSFGISKGHLLTMAGFGLLYTFLGMDRMGSFALDNQRCLRIVCTSLNRDQIAGHLDFQDLVNAVALPPLALDQADFRSSKGLGNGPTPSLHKKRLNMVQKQQSLQPSHGRSSSANIVRVKREPMDEAISTRRSATSSLLLEDAGILTGDNVHNFAFHAALNSHRPYSFPVSSSQASPDAVSLPNLDYLDFSCESPPSFQQNDANGGMDCSMNSVNLMPQNNNTIPALGAFSSVTGSGSSDSFAWSSGSWTPPSTFDRPNPSSVLSFSDESLTSAEDLSTLLPAEFLTATV